MGKRDWDRVKKTSEFLKNNPDLFKSIEKQIFNYYQLGSSAEDVSLEKTDKVSSDLE